jgi:hypothetical protein
VASHLTSTEYRKSVDVTRRAESPSSVTQTGKDKMTSELTNTNTTSVPALPLDHEGLKRLGDFAASQQTRIVQGREIRFVDGAWILKAGSEDEKDSEIGRDVQFTARPDLLTWCWTKWIGQKPVDRSKFGTMMQVEPPTRDQLGDLDNTKWEMDTRTNTPRDPWTYTLMLPLLDSDGEKFVFVTQSNGGIKELGALASAFIKHAFDHGGMEMPLVELSGDKYFNKKFSRYVHTPQINILDWVAVNSGTNDADPDDEIPF